MKSIAVRNIIDDFDLFNRKITKFSPFFLTRGTIFRGVRAERIVFLYAICTGKGNRITSNDKNYERRQTSCTPCEQNFEDNINELVDQVEDYTRKDRMRKEREVEEAFRRGQGAER